VILDEFQYISKFIYRDEACESNPDTSLPGSFHTLSESKLAPMLVIGSYVSWLLNIMYEYLEAGRLTPIEFSPYLTREAGLEAVYRYAEVYNTPITNETAPPTPTGVKALALAAHAQKKAERERSFAAARTLAERIDDPSGLAFVYFQQAHSFWWRETATARCAFDQGEAVARACGDAWQLAQILRARGEFDYTRLEARAEARAHMAESLALFRQLGDRYGVADALVHLADVAFEQGNLAAVELYGAEGLDLSLTLGFTYGVLWGVMVLGSAAGGQGDFAQSRLLLEECVTIARELGSATFTGLALYWLATTLRLQYEECRVVAKEDNDQTMLAGADYGLGEVARRRGDYALAATHFQQALTTWREIDYQWGLARVLGSLGLLAFAQAQPIAATRLLSAASTRRHAALLGFTPLEQAEVDAAQATLQTMLGEAAFAVAWQTGQTLTLDEWVR
jgi:tetratricopeptide (TPR) repeat protein